MRGGAVWQRGWLITNRSQVQILFPQPKFIMSNLLPSISLRVDDSTIRRAIELAGKQTRGTMDKLIGYSAYYIAVRAQKYMPAADIATIDSELDETIQVGKSSSNTMTRGQAIILARMNPNSRFNEITSNRWAMNRPNLSADKFHRAYGDGGMAKRVLWETINNADERNRSARHSSTHFLKSGWKAVKTKIKALGFRLSGNILGISESDDNNSTNTLDSSVLGNVDSGGEGTGSPWMLIENLVGTKSPYDNLREEHNAAMLDYGVPALNQAMAEQAVWMRDKYFPRATDEIAAAWYSVPDAGSFVPGTHVPLARRAEDEDAKDLVAFD